MEEPAEKLRIKYDKDAVNTVELIIYEESHTLANMIRDRILENDACTFCAYKMTHPSDNFVSVRASAVESRPVRLMVLESLRLLSKDIDGLASRLKI